MIMHQRIQKSPFRDMLPYMGNDISGSLFEIEEPMFRAAHVSENPKEPMTPYRGAAVGAEALTAHA